MMHPVRTTLLATALALLAAAALIALARPAYAAGSADVRFVEPERFSDAGRNPADRERALAALGEHLKSLAARLPDGQRLKVEVTDVDLAGEEVMRAGRELRVLRGAADIPRIQLRWTLEQGSSALKSGEERLTDLGYISARLPLARMQGDLPYERYLLTEWFRAQFEGGR